MNGPLDAETRRRWRKERAQLARRLHPDLAGDHERYVAELAALDASYGVAQAGSLTSVSGRRTAWQRIRRSAQHSGRRMTTLRSRLRRARGKERVL